MNAPYRPGLSLHVMGLGLLAKTPGMCCFAAASAASRSGLAGEAAGVVLHQPQAVHVFDAIPCRIDVAHHHRARRAHPLLVGDPHDPQPIVGRRLDVTDLVTHALREDLAPAARQGHQARVDEPLHDLADVHAPEPLELDELRRAEGVDVDRRVLATG